MLHSTRLTFGTKKEQQDFDATMVIGKREDLAKSGDIPNQNLLDSISGESGSASTWTHNHQVVVCMLPSKVSRNNQAMSVQKMTKLVQSNCPKGNVNVIVCCNTNKIAPLASAVAKAFPLYNKKTSETKEREVHVKFVNDGIVVNASEEIKAAQAVSEGVRLAARLADTPPEELTTTAYSEECRQLANELDHVSFSEVVGMDLHDAGYGGLYGVGKAASCPPRLIIMEYNPPASDSSTIALVGKGIVYDTGGLSLKPKTGMAGMKHDMGGSAGMLGGFYAACKLGTKKKLLLLMCVAENAIGPGAFRNDDILTMKSGKTVEINNCDAEGRLVLADGVSHASSSSQDVNLIIDMATLTGAQMVATGKRHAGILANTLELEQRALEAGLHSGDLVFPLLYEPDLMEEFNSKVADMKNSVKDRGNAQSSCAGHFIEAHLSEDYKGGWLHVDMAGPSTNDERATGYGVGLVLSLLEAPGF